MGTFELGLDIHTESRALRHDAELCWYLEHHDKDGGEEMSQGHCKRALPHMHDLDCNLP